MSFSFKRGKSSWVLAGLVGGLMLWSAVGNLNWLRLTATEASMSIDPDGHC